MTEKTTGLSRSKTSRIEAFSDGVFAIVITLLVFQIKIPELRDALSSREAWNALVALAPNFSGFVLGFAFIAVFWINHHRFFELVAYVDWRLMWGNNLLLLFLCFVPFPTGFIGEYPRNPVALALFAIVLSLTGVVFNLMWRHARRHALILPSVPPATVQQAIRRGLVGPCLYGMAAISAFLAPLFSWVIFLAVPVFYCIPVKAIEQNGEAL